MIVDLISCRHDRLSDDTVDLISFKHDRLSDDTVGLISFKHDRLSGITAEHCHNSTTASDKISHCKVRVCSSKHIFSRIDNFTFASQKRGCGSGCR